MIDAHAKSELNAGIVNRQFGGAHLTQEAVEVLRHALQAITDRASLIERVDTVPLPDGVCIAIDVAKRHMRGEE